MFGWKLNFNPLLYTVSITYLLTIVQFYVLCNLGERFLIFYSFIVFQTWLLAKDEAGCRLEETFFVQFIKDVLWLLKHTIVVT